MLHLDFETRSEVDITRSGAWRYSVDDSTSVLCLSYWLNPKRPPSLWLPGMPPPQDLFDAIQRRELCYAHNAFFERVIWRNVCVRKMGWPAVPNALWRCTAAVAAAHALPRRLGQVNLALGLPHDVQKDSDGIRLIGALCKPKARTKEEIRNGVTERRWNNDPVKLNRLYNYCKQDVRAEAALSQRLSPLNPFELRVWQADQRINERGVYVDTQAISRFREIVSKYERDQNAQLRKITQGKVKKATELDKLFTWLIDDLVLEVNNLDKAAVNTLLTCGWWTIEPHHIEALEIRKSLGKASVAKLRAMERAVDPRDSRIRDTLMYHGAATGRWAGKIVQFQNVPRGKLSVDEIHQVIEYIKKPDAALDNMPVFADPMDIASSCLRSLVTAPPGRELIAADYSAIEARGVCWLADDLTGLAEFTGDRDVYKIMSSRIYDIPYEAVDDKEQRHLGKGTVLGCGYQMGIDKFRRTCVANGLHIDEKMAEKAVHAYRTARSKVVAMWWNQNQAAVDVVTKKKTEAICGKVRWFLEGDFLFCELPSKRRLAYYKPRFEKARASWSKDDEGKTDWVEAVTYMGVNGYTKKWERMSTYGGKLVENITQAVCRDIIAEAIVRIEEGPYPYDIVLSVHDELVAEVDEDKGSLDEFIGLLTQLPKWAEGFPIKAEGWRGKRYRK